MLDFTKAFDFINHLLLLDKLQSYGLPANILRWMATFLLDRAQRVKIGNEYSHSGHPNGGVPQGTLSGPKRLIVSKFGVAYAYAYFSLSRSLALSLCRSLSLSPSPPLSLSPSLPLSRSLSLSLPPPLSLLSIVIVPGDDINGSVLSVSCFARR